jgi:hypothetical protein
VNAKSNSKSSDEPGEVFRQFAWHLAGSLASSRAGKSDADTTSKPRPQRAGKR